MQTSYWYSSYSRLSISTPVVTSQFLSSQIKVIYVFNIHLHSYQYIPLLSCTPDNNSVLLKYATTHTTADRGTVHELRPRLFPHFVVNSLLLQSNSAPFQVALPLLHTSLTSQNSMSLTYLSYPRKKTITGYLTTPVLHLTSFQPQLLATQEQCLWQCNLVQRIKLILRWKDQEKLDIQ